MSRNLLARKPVLKIKWNYDAAGDGNVTTAAWTSITAAMSKSVAAVEIFDSSGRILSISTGAVGSENGSIIPYYIIPGGSGILLPLELANNVNLSIKAVDANATTGYLIINCFD